MSRYFLEVAYKGTRYAGFQVQHNAVTIQGEVDKALSLLLKTAVKTTGSSRTDAGVHACQNYLHFDSEAPLYEHLRYQLNAVLPPDIAATAIYAVVPGAHARFDAVSRTYAYHLYRRKDPFRRETGYFFPYPLAEERLHEMAHLIASHRDFRSFSKRNTQVKTFDCRILHAAWERRDDGYIFHISANRFLRGMVRGLVGTMIRIARGADGAARLTEILNAADNRQTDFSAPAQGLFLVEVRYPDGEPGRRLPG
jgi:tRNA pseudouridine38-40 synthase